MARERSIVVRLKAEVSDFKNQMGQAARSLSDFEREQQKMGGAATTTMGRLVQSARINEQAWSTVGKTMLGIGGAIAGVGIAALKTGIEYNTLQQTSRAALATIMGGAKQANQQMDRLDDFARNSPFAKQVFIQAQQQMLGFGIEAQKVVPYLDAIQNAVAATGGSNQDIAELSEIFSKVQASAKITATDLMQFGKRGVDAATLIGSQMGKTGAEIREEITAGTLNAGEALDALAAGMQDRFGGAAANVKETLAGAFDRVKAAWRDLSSELASPLVGPEGGGLAIDWLNRLADAMRAFQNAPGWVKGATTAVGVLTSVVALSTGAFMLAVPKYAQFTEAVKTLSNTHPSVEKLGTAASKTAVFLTKLAAAFAATSVVGHIFASNMVGAAASTNELEVAMRNLDFDVPFEHMASGYDSFHDSLRTLTGSGVFDLMDRGLSGLVDLITGGRSAATLATTAFEDMGTSLAALGQAGELDEMTRRFTALADQAALVGVETSELLDLMPGFRDYLIGVADSMGYATTDAVLLKIATGELKVATDDTTDAIEGEVSALEQLRNAHREAADATLASLNSEIRFRESIDRATEGIKENGESLDLTTEKGRANQSMLNDLAAAGYAFVDSANDQEAAMQEVRDAFVKAGQDAGMTKAEVEALADELGLIPGDYVAELKADDTEARATFGRMVGDWENTQTDTKLGMNPRPANAVWDAETGKWKETTTDTRLGLDTKTANVEFGKRQELWKNTTTDTNLGLDPWKSDVEFGKRQSLWKSTTTNTNLGLNTSQATSTLNSWKSRNASFTVFANVSVRGGENLAALGKYRGGFIQKGLHTGGKVLPGLNAGGRVPGPRAGYDNIMWPLHSGGRVLGQPLEGGEYVVRSSQALRYAPQLEAMNAGTYPTGGGGSSLSRADMHAFARIVAAETASAVEGASERGSARGAAAGTRSGISGAASATLLSTRAEDY